MADVVLDTLFINVDSDTTDANNGLLALQKTLSKFKSAANSGSSGINRIRGSFSSFTSKVRKATSVFRVASEILGSWFKESNDYVEALNLFNVAMGDCADSAMKYAKNVEAVMGVDLKEWLTYQGAFYQLAVGYGIASDSAERMSKNLTQLAYDLSSLWNTDTETAFQKLQSGMSGQIKGLKVWGINVSVAQLKQTALSLGIDLATSKMTEAQKATLRYVTIMKQTSNAQGDLARTIVTPTNALRILNAQWTQAKRAMGQVVSVIAVKVIPWFQALIQIIKEAAQSLANSLGYELPDIKYPDIKDIGIDTSTFDNVADSLGQATDNAKKLKNNLLGIDELNVVSNETSSALSDTLGGGYAPDFGLDLSQYDYDFLSKLEMPDLEPMKEKLQTIFKIARLIGEAITGWKIGSFIADLLTANMKASTLKETLYLIGKKTSLTLGITLAVTGITVEISGMIDAIKNGLNSANFTQVIAGGGGLIGGAALIGKFFGSTLIGTGIGEILAGVPMLITGLYDAIINGINWLSAALVSAGATATGAGIGAIIGACGGPIGAGVGALIGLAVGLVTDLVILVVQNWETITTWCSDACSKIGEFFSDLWNDIVSVWNTVSKWFDKRVIQPVTTFFKQLWNNIVTFANNCWNGIVSVFSPIIDWFARLFGSVWQTISDVFYDIGVIAGGCLEIIKRAWGIVSAWFNEKVIQPVGNFFSGLWNGIKETAIFAWNGIKSVFSTIGSWINTTVIQPVSNFFSGLWNGFLEKAKNAWDGVKKVFSKVASFFKDTFEKAWKGVIKVFSVAGDIFVDIKDGIVSAFKKVVNGLIKGINNVVSLPFKAINSALTAVRDIEILGIKPFSAIKTINIPQIPTLANGGFPTTGQMFIAREAGPEMVGNIGNRTAVANNDQIVEAVSLGVYQAVCAAMDNDNDGGNTTITINLDGEKIYENQQKIARNRGYNLGMGAFSFG